MITIVFLTSPQNSTKESQILNVLNENEYFPKVDSHHKNDLNYFKSYFEDQICRFYKYDSDNILKSYFLEDFVNGPDLAVVLEKEVDVNDEDWKKIDEYLDVIFDGGYYPIIKGDRLDNILIKPVNGFCIGNFFIFKNRWYY